MLSSIEAALEPEKVYNVEKLLASRLAGGKKQYQVRWESSDEEEEVPAAALETDLEKYLKLPELPLTMADGKPADILSWWKQRDHSLPADPQTNRPEGLPRLARMARQYHNEPATSAGAERLFSAASRAHHDLKGAMNDNSLEHELLALANTD